MAATIEVSADTNIQSQLSGLFLDAKANLEAGKFISGTGTGEPTGIVTALTGGASSRDTIASTAYARADILALQEAVPPRFRSNARFMMSLEVLNMSREFPKLSGGVDVGLVDDSSNPPRLRGWPVTENSSMSSALIAGSKIALAGQFSNYLVVDRIGAVVEYIPHLLGVNRRPVGQRGFYMHWRTGGDVLRQQAFRMLNVKV